MTSIQAPAVPVEAFLASMHARIDATLRPLLADAPRVALLDFPAHPNVGDSAIWIGELATLRACGIPSPSFVCSAVNYDATALRKAIGSGVILLHGGGNFGDVWPHHQVFRERVLRDFPEHRIVQLPQSIHFAGKAALERARRAVAAHRQFTLLVRCERSLSIAQTQFDAPAHLCPDLALRLGTLPRGRRLHGGVVLLRRTDKEVNQLNEITLPEDIEQLDWLEDSTGAMRTTERIALESLIRIPRAARYLGFTPASLYERLARERVTRGLQILSRGRGVITDRLHAHILCLMADIPHCLLDNNYGKVRAVYEAWTRGVGQAAWCETQEDAFARIGGLMSAEA